MRLKKNYLIISILIILIILFLVWFLTIRKNDYYEPLTIYISNETEKSENISVIVFDNNQNEIYNKTVLVKPGEYEHLGEITDKKGSYTIKAYVDEIRTKTDDSIMVGKSRGSVHIRIHADKLELDQKME